MLGMGCFSTGHACVVVCLSEMLVSRGVRGARGMGEISFKVGSGREVSGVGCREAMSSAVESCIVVAEMAVEGGVVADRNVLSGGCVYEMGGRGGCDLLCAADTCKKLGEEGRLPQVIGGCPEVTGIIVFVCCGVRCLGPPDRGRGKMLCMM